MAWHGMHLDVAVVSRPEMLLPYISCFTGQLQLTAQQLREELSSTFTPLQAQLQATTLTQHSFALEGTRSVAAAVQMLAGLPDTTAELSAQLEELAQTQRAAEGQLGAGREHRLVLDQQIATVHEQLQELEATVAAQQEQEGRAVQQMRQELLDPVVEVRVVLVREAQVDGMYSTCTACLLAAGRLLKFKGRAGAEVCA
jgi:hypothetical protein